MGVVLRRITDRRYGSPKIRLGGRLSALNILLAGMVELVDIPDLGSGALLRRGSNPLVGTIEV